MSRRKINLVAGRNVRVNVDAEGQPYTEPVDWDVSDPLPSWEKPPRKSDFAKYRMMMIDFVEWHLIDNAPKVYGPEDFSSLFNPFASELYAAEKGDIEPLRKKLPKLAKFLHLPPEPKRKQGQRATGSFYSVPKRAQLAADLVPKIRKLWEETYQKKVRKQEPSAEDIAAHIYSVKIKDVKLLLGRKRLEKHRAK